MEAFQRTEAWGLAPHKKKAPSRHIQRKSMDRLHATYAGVAICCILMKICCFHGTTSKLYYPKTRPQGFLGSACSGHLLLEVASWLPKKGNLFIFSPKISFWVLFGIFWDFSGFVLDCCWSPGRMPWGLLPIFGGAFPKECPGAWHPFLVGAFQKKRTWGLAPMSCGGLPENRGLGPGTP